MKKQSDMHSVLTVERCVKWTASVCCVELKNILIANQQIYCDITLIEECVRVCVCVCV